MTAARARLFQVIESIDVDTGLFRPVPNAVCTFREPGTTTPLAQTIYAAATGATTLSNPVTADADGTLEVYLATAQRVNLLVTGVGLGSIVIEHEPVMDDPIDLMKTSVSVNSAAFAFTLKNTHALGKTIDIQNPAGWSVFNSQRSAGGNDVISINKTNTTLPETTLLLVAHSPSVDYVVSDHVLNALGTGRDQGALRGVADQRNSGGNNLIRAVEGRAMRLAPAIIGGTWALELNITSDVAGTIPTHLVGAFISAGAGLAGQVRADSGVWVGGAAGFKWPFLSVDLDNATVLFRSDQNGKVTAGNISPRADATYSLGSSSSDAWLALYADIVAITGAGGASAPPYTFYAETTTGMYFGGTGILGFSTSGTMRALLNTTQLALEGSLVGKHATDPVNPASGYVAMAPNPDGFWYKRLNGGSKVKMHDDSQFVTLEVAGVTVSPTTTSASYADLTDMTLTFTGCVAGDKLEIEFTGAFFHSATGGAIVVALKHDANAETRAFSISAPVATYPFLITTHGVFVATAGTNVIKVRWLTGAATATANSVDRYLKGVRRPI